MKTSLRTRKIPGGVCAPQGFLASGVCSGIKKTEKPDLALIVSQTPCNSAGTFTCNRAKAAPVLFNLEIIRHPVQGVIMNSGNANACTGQLGLKNAKEMSRLSMNTVSKLDGVKKTAPFLVCSTGRIGVQLPMPKIKSGISLAVKTLSKKDQIAAEAIMTSDTFSKRIAMEIRIGGVPVRIGGMAKGAGMIHPLMNASGNPAGLHATMLCLVTTDAMIHPKNLQQCLDQAVSQSFNRITVDGDMSTNDTVLLLANGKASNPILKSGSKELKIFQQALNEVTLALALMIVRDGEGISKNVTVKVSGAASQKDAEKAVRAIANSTLVKCSWCGEDPNWGRIYDAVGYSGSQLNSSTFSIKYNDILLIKNGLEISSNFKNVRKIVQKPSFSILFNLNLGKYEALMYTTDLTEKYVEFNKGE